MAAAEFLRPLTVCAALLTTLSLQGEGLASRNRRQHDIMKIDEVRPGMRGHAVTVFSGEATDRFDIEVVDVIRNYLPRQDAILFRSPDPRLIHSGIVGGMSGSPIYIDGKLVGALASSVRNRVRARLLTLAQTSSSLYNPRAHAPCLTTSSELS